MKAYKSDLDKEELTDKITNFIDENISDSPTYDEWSGGIEALLTESESKE